MYFFVLTAGGGALPGGHIDYISVVPCRGVNLVFRFDDPAMNIGTNKKTSGNRSSYGVFTGKCHINQALLQRILLRLRLGKSRESDIDQLIQKHAVIHITNEEIV